MYTDPNNKKIIEIPFMPFIYDNPLSFEISLCFLYIVKFKKLFFILYNESIDL